MKQMLLALDVSTSTTGYVVMDNQLNLIKYGQFSITDRKLSDIEYATIITKEVFKIVNEFNITNLIIEDVFFGKNVNNFKTWCRVQGAIGMSWAVKHNAPVFMMAVEARRRTQIRGQATKIEIQLEVCETYKLINNGRYIAYHSQFEDLLEKRQSKKYTKNQFDYRVKKLSKAFEDETGISEHIADANLLARAYFDKIGG